MGCDIHIHLEYKSFRSEKTWVCGDYFYLNPYYTDETENDGEEQYNLVGLCADRNYSRFATLADVRNYGGTPCISRPRGLPYDVSEAVKADADRWGSDGHSHSYLTLQEMIDFQKSGVPLRHRGMISPKAQQLLDKCGIHPKEWCQGTNQPGWEFRSWTEENHALDDLIESIKVRADELYVIPEWQWDDAPEKAYEKAKDVRIVFWFDN